MGKKSKGKKNNKNRQNVAKSAPLPEAGGEGGDNYDTIRALESFGISSNTFRGDESKINEKLKEARGHRSQIIEMYESKDVMGYLDNSIDDYEDESFAALRGVYEQGKYWIEIIDKKVQEGERCHVIRSNIEDVNTVYKKMNRQSTKPNSNQLTKIEGSYLNLGQLIKFTQKEHFGEVMSKNDIDYWMDHIMKQMNDGIINNGNDISQQWVNMEGPYCHMLMTCVAFFEHPYPVIAAFQKGFFELLVTSMATKLPPPSIAHAIVSSMKSVICTATSDENKATMFKKIESCGLLLQFIRCSTIIDTKYRQSTINVYDLLIHYAPKLIKKRFAVGQPCGDCVHSILKDNSTKNNDILGKLKMIELITNTNTNTERPSIHGNSKETQNIRNELGYRMCGYCFADDTSEEFQSSLKVCNRCKATVYCSKECQTTDWPNHKKLCRLTTADGVARSAVHRKAFEHFMSKNKGSMVGRLSNLVKETGMKPKELLVELDFLSRDNLLAPVFRDPPEYSIKEASGYFEGARPYAPEWMDETFTSETKDIFRRRKDDTFICIFRCADGSPDRLTINWSTPTSEQIQQYNVRTMNMLLDFVRSTDLLEGKK